MYIHIYIYIYIYIYVLRSLNSAHEKWGQKKSVAFIILASVYTLTAFNCLVTQIANKPITWQQLNAFRNLDVVKTTC